MLVQLLKLYQDVVKLLFVMDNCVLLDTTRKRYSNRVKLNGSAVECSPVRFPSNESFECTFEVTLRHSLSQVHSVCGHC